MVDDDLSFEITKELAFLIEKLTKTTSLKAIASEFKAKFSHDISEEAIAAFLDQCIESNLFEKVAIEEVQDVQIGTSQVATDDVNVNQFRDEEPSSDPVQDSQHISSDNWMQRIFRRQTLYLADKIKKNRKAFVALSWLISPISLIAFISAIANWKNIFYVDESAEVQVAFLVVYVLNLLIVQYTSISVLTAACYSEGGTEILDTFGFKLKLGFLPRFFVSRAPIYKLPLSRRARIFASPLLAKFIMFGIFLFISTNITLKGSIISYIFLSASHAALIELVLTSVPLAPVDGYGLYVSITRKSPLLYRTAKNIFLQFLQRVKRPSHIPLNEYRYYLTLGFLALAYYVGVGLWITIYFADLAVSSLGEIFGGATFFMILLVLVGLFMTTLVDPRELADNFMSSEQVQQKQSRPIQSEERSESDSEKPFKYWPYISIAFLGLLIPVPFSIGGRVVSLSEANSQLIAQEDGFIAEVNAGSSSRTKIVEKDTLIFRLNSPTISDQISSAKELVEASRQQLMQQQEILRKLENAPNEDDVNIQLKYIESIQSKLDKQTKQIISLKADKAYADLDEERYRQLVLDGAASKQELDKKIALAESARGNLLSGEQDVETSMIELETEKAKLRKLEKGSAPEDIAKAKAAVAESKSRLNNQKDALNSLERRQERLAIYMPYDGKIITPRLDELLYSRVKKGDQLAEIYGQHGSNVQLRTSEFDAQYLAVGNKSEVRLSAFPGKRFSGVVTSINPAAIGQPYDGNEKYSNSEIGTVYVEIQLNPRSLNQIGLLPGMTGYAKVNVGYQPIIVTITRPLQRFMQLDFWTWFP